MRFDPRRAIIRTVIATSIGISVGFIALAREVPGVISVLSGIVAGGVVLLGLIWSLFGHCTASKTQKRAASDDPGRTAVYSLMLNTSFISLFAATVLGSIAQRHVGSGERRVLVALCLATVAIAWSLTHSTFALRYAHLYYREDAEGVGGVEFPGGAAPTYADFAYLAFTVGMCFQVSDVTISSPQIRRSVLLHAVMSFVYATALLAFVLNLAFGLAS
jgi:uncharacterized membrane protein